MGKEANSGSVAKKQNPVGKFFSNLGNDFK